jgi:uncharacterized protein YbjT (DUF2867 family)
MRVALFGATGMIGQGVLRECLRDPRVWRVLAIGRSRSAVTHEKLEQLVLCDMLDYAPIASRLAGVDACFYCLGITSAGLGEAEYRRITVDYTVAAAEALLKASPRVRMCFVSGTGADSSEQSRTMWARVKGRAENALLALPFDEVTIFRPGIVRPLHGITSRTAWTRATYTLLGPLLPIVERLAPGSVTTTERIGRAMIHVADRGSKKRILENADINAIAARANEGPAPEASD